MKTTLFLSVLFCAIALPALGELTDTDLNRIRLIINEEIKKESSTTNKKIDALDARIQNVEKDVAWVRGKLDGIDKQITHATNITYALIALIVAAVAIPQILIALRSGRDRALERQVETLIQEVETLKQQRIVNP
jgi:archaellum component FlaC